MILITGSSGFVGTYLTNLNSESNVRYVTRETIHGESESNFRIDTLDTETDWTNAFDDISAIIHLAGLAHNKQTLVGDFDVVNNKATIRLATEAAKAGVKRFVFISSICVNGRSSFHQPFSTKSHADPYNSYAQSKYDAEVGLKKIAKETGLEVVIVRPTLVYGPNAPGNFGSLIKLVKKLPFLPFGLADNKRDFIAVQNLADLLMACAKHPSAAGHTFLGSDGETVSIKVFTNAIAKGLNVSSFQLPIPISLMRLAARLVGKLSIAEQLLGDLQVDSSNALDILGWTPPYTMEQAMASLSERKK